MTRRERLSKDERLSRQRGKIPLVTFEWQAAGYWKGEQGKEAALAAAHSYDVMMLCALMNSFRQMDLGADGLTPDGYKPSTERSYQAGIKSWVQWAEARAIDLLSPDPDFFLLWLRDIESRRSVSTVRTYRAGVGRLYNALRRLGVTGMVPLEGAKFKKDSRPVWERREKYSREDIQKLIEAAQDMGNLALALAVVLGADAGLRASEIVAVRYCDIDVTAGIIKVRRAKREKPRQAALVARGLRLFQSLPPFANKRAYLYPHTARTLRTELQGLCQVAGVRYLGVHSLRHAHGTFLAERGLTLNALAAQMGHSTITSSMPYIKLEHFDIIRKLDTQE